MNEIQFRNVTWGQSIMVDVDERSWLSTPRYIDLELSDSGVEATKDD